VTPPDHILCRWADAGGHSAAHYRENIPLFFPSVSWEFVRYWFCFLLDVHFSLTSTVTTDASIRRYRGHFIRHSLWPLFPFSVSCACWRFSARPPASDVSMRLLPPAFCSRFISFCFASITAFRQRGHQLDLATRFSHPTLHSAFRISLITTYIKARFPCEFRNRPRPTSSFNGCVPMTRRMPYGNKFADSKISIY